MDPAQYSSKAFAACFFAAANSLFLISESFLMSLAIIPSSFKISLHSRHPHQRMTVRNKISHFTGCSLPASTRAALSSQPPAAFRPALHYRAICAGAPSCRASIAASPPSPPVVCLPAPKGLRLTVRVLPAFPPSGFFLQCHCRTV